MRWGPVSKKQAKNSQKSAHLWQKKSCRLCYTSISLWKKCSLQPRRPPRELPGINEFKAVAAGETASLSPLLSSFYSSLFSHHSIQFGNLAPPRRADQDEDEPTVHFLPSAACSRRRSSSAHCFPPSLPRTSVNRASRQPDGETRAPPAPATAATQFLGGANIRRDHIDTRRRHSHVGGRAATDAIASAKAAGRRRNGKPRGRGRIEGGRKERGAPARAPPSPPCGEIHRQEIYHVCGRRRGRGATLPAVVRLRCSLRRYV